MCAIQDSDEAANYVSVEIYVTFFRIARKSHSKQLAQCSHHVLEYAHYGDAAMNREIIIILSSNLSRYYYPLPERRIPTEQIELDQAR